MHTPHLHDCALSLAASQSGAPIWMYATGAFIRDDSGNVLLVHDAKRGWELPGGKIDAGENQHEALEREVYEETGLRMRVRHLISIYITPWKHERKWLDEITDPIDIRISSSDVLPRSVERWANLFTLYAWNIPGVTPPPRVSSEHIDARWFSEDDIASLVVDWRTSRFGAYRLMDGLAHTHKRLHAIQVVKLLQGLEEFGRTTQCERFSVIPRKRTIAIISDGSWKEILSVRKDRKLS